MDQNKLFPVFWPNIGPKTDFIKSLTPLCTTTTVQFCQPSMIYELWKSQACALLSKRAGMIFNSTNLAKRPPPRDILLEQKSAICANSCNMFRDIKFVYSEKATKFCEISTLLLSTVHTDKNKVVFSDYMNFTKRKWMCLSRSKVRMKLYFDNVPKYSKFEVEIQICKLVNFYACLTAKSKFFLFHFICLNSYEVQIFWEGLQQYWEIFIQVFAHSLKCLKSI